MQISETVNKGSEKEDMKPRLKIKLMKIKLIKLETPLETPLWPYKGPMVCGKWAHNDKSVPIFRHALTFFQFNIFYQNLYKLWQKISHHWQIGSLRVIRNEGQSTDHIRHTTNYCWPVVPQHGVSQNAHLVALQSTSTSVPVGSTMCLYCNYYFGHVIPYTFRDIHCILCSPVVKSFWHRDRSICGWEGSTHQ